MHKISFYIIILLTQANILVGQCDLKNDFIINVDSLNCCNQIKFENHLKSNHDTIKFKWLYYELICKEEIDNIEFNLKIDTIETLEHKFLSSETDSEFLKFRSQNYIKIRDCKRRIFELGYRRSLEINDYLTSSLYANRLASCYNDIYSYKNQEKWQRLELINFQKYAADDYIKLIEFHKFWLFSDNTNPMFRNLPFEGYDHLVKIISKHHSKSEFESILEKGIESGKIVSKQVCGRPQFSLLFTLEGTPFEFFEDDISKLYFPDTTLVDTVVVYDCYGNDPRGSEYIEIRKNPIFNQIDNLNEMSMYKSRLRRSVLFGILKWMENR